VEDVTDFVQLKQRGTEQTRVTEELRERAEQMEAEIFIRAQELQQKNRQLREANERLAQLGRAKISPGSRRAGRRCPSSRPTFRYRPPISRALFGRSSNAPG
jgi:hypothetical protein